MISTTQYYKNILLALTLLLVVPTGYSSKTDDIIQLRGGATTTTTTNTDENVPTTITLPLVRRTTVTKRESRRLRHNNSRQLEENDGGWCPTHYPGDGTKCALSGWNYGTCYWSSSNSGASAQNGDMYINYDPRACSCNQDGTSTFECWKMDSFDPLPNQPPTNPSNPTTKPPTLPPTTKASSNNNSSSEVFDCPESAPADGSSCPLSGMWVGTCNYWSWSSQGGQEAVECTCNHDGKSKYSCRDV